MKPFSSKVGISLSLLHDRNWTGFEEELIHHTSRYYAYTESFLRNVSGIKKFQMAGYHAENLSPGQRRLMTAILCSRPSVESGRDIIRIINHVCTGKNRVDGAMAYRYRKQLKMSRCHIMQHYDCNRCRQLLAEEIAPLDPFFAIANRLRLPVACKNHHIEVSLRLLARHLDSLQSQMRENLHEAILRLHQAGYRLHNHPGLTHQKAKLISDDDAV